MSKVIPQHPILFQSEKNNILLSHACYFFKGEVIFDIKIMADRTKQSLDKVRLLNGMILVNKQFDAQFFFMCVYFYSLHLSGSHVPIIRRIIVRVRHLIYVTPCR